MVDNEELVNEVENVGVNIDENGLPDLVGEFGFVNAMEDAIA